MTLRNRICSTGHMASWMHHNGVPNDRCRAYFEERAKGGIALVTLGATAVREGDHPAYFQNLDDRFISSYRALTQAVHRPRRQIHRPVLSPRRPGAFFRIL